MLVLENELLYAVKADVPVSDDYVLPIGRAKILEQVLMLLLSRIAVVLMLVWKRQQAYLPRV